MDTSTRKVDQIIHLMEHRIRRGDYLLREVPSERRLSEEVGASRMTARKAILHLMEQGLLRRQESGRVEVSQMSAKGPVARIAFLAPAWPSSQISALRLGLERAASALDVFTKPVEYTHWQDPVIQETLDAFDGVFMMMAKDPLPKSVIEMLHKTPRPLVVLDADMTSMGLRCIDPCPPFFIGHLLDYVASLGHRHIDCFNVQPMQGPTVQRIEQWSLWRANNDMPGELINEAVESFKSAYDKGYEVAGQALDKKRFKGTAALCITTPAALGLMRAMQDRGLTPGKDLSVCVVNDEGFNRLLSPSLTCLAPVDIKPYVTLCIERLILKRDDWAGPLLMRPSEVPLFKGESTGRCPR